MRVKKSSNANMRFLFGSVLFFAVIVLVVMLFTYYAVRHASKKNRKEEVVYVISFSDSLEGSACNLYLCDSLLYSGNPVDSKVIVEAKSSWFANRVGDSPVLLVEVPGKDTLSLQVGKERVFHLGLNADTLLVDCN